MLRLVGETDLEPALVIERALEFFSGEGLEMEERAPDMVGFRGAGGVVRVVATREPGAARTSVEIVSREWDQAAKRFVRTLPRQGPLGRLLRRLFGGG